MFGNVKTAWFAQWQLAKTLRQSHVVLPYTTINEKLSIEAGTASDPNNDSHEMLYMTIGRGGYVNVGTNGRNTLMHKVTDACLFEHMPVRMAPLSAPLDPAERDRYRLRKVETHGGVQYEVFYAFSIDFTSATPETSVITVNAGVEDVDPFVSDAAQLNPTAVTLVNGAPVTTSNRSIRVRAPIELVLSSQDLQYISEACEIIYGNTNSAIISEIAYCTGVDKQVTSTAGGTSVTYVEAIECQPANFVNDDINVQFTSGSITIRYNLGTTLRLLT